MPTKYWLMKAEPDSRVVKGKDVKFSVNDFEDAKVTAWEGVRNHEAKNLMKEMKVGDKVLFYHSNCKVPGIAGFAEVSKEAYPDHTAWDPNHPYYDPKSEEANPKWYMIDATFIARAVHFVPLALMRSIADAQADEPPEHLIYIGRDGVAAVKGMALVNRGRLSVQRVEESAWTTISLLAEKGGWEDVDFGKKGKTKAKDVVKGNGKQVQPKGKRKAKTKKEDIEEEEQTGESGEDEEERQRSSKRKRKAGETDEGEIDDQSPPRRRLARRKT